MVMALVDRPVGRCARIFTVLLVGLASVALASGLAVADDCVYVGLAGGDKLDGIAVVDARTLSVAKMIPVPGGVFAVAVDHTRLRAYVDTGYYSTAVVDLRTNSIVASIPYPCGVAGFRLFVLSPDGSRLYGLATNSLGVIDLTSGAVLMPPVDIHANNGEPLMDITPDGRFLYVARQYYGLSVVDTTTFSIVGNVSGFPPGTFAYSVVIAPDGTRAYTVDPGNMVSVIDTSTNAIVDRIRMKQCRTVNDVPENCGSTSLAVSPDGQRVYVANAIDESIGVIDTQTNSETFPTWLGDPRLPGSYPHPVFIAVSPDSQFLAVTHYRLDSDLAQPNFLWRVAGLGGFPIRFSDSPVPVFSDRALAIASVPSGCAGISACIGDCDGALKVTVDNLVEGVDIALGTMNLSVCPAFDADGDGHVAVNELVGAVNNALNGCPGGTPTPVTIPTCPSAAMLTPTATSTLPPTPTPSPTDASTASPMATGCGAVPPRVTALYVGDCHDPTAVIMGTVTALGPSTTVRVCGELACRTLDLPATFPMTYPFSLRVGVVGDSINHYEACSLNLTCGDVACTREYEDGRPLIAYGPTPFVCQRTPTITPTPSPCTGCPTTPTPTHTYAP